MGESLQLLLVALESATRVLSRDKPLLQLYINNEINALSSLYNIQVVNQLVFYRFIFFLAFFCSLISFASPAQEIPDSQTPNKLCKFIENERHFLFFFSSLFFFHLSRIYVCRFALLLFIH